MVQSDQAAKLHFIQGFSPARPDFRVYEEIRKLVSDPHSQDYLRGSFFVLDLNQVIQKFGQWKDLLPTVAPHYAVKANPNKGILSTLATLGANFDCATEAEIQEVLRLGVSPDRIIFANPCKPLAHLEYAEAVGVKRTTFDSESELVKIAAVHPNAELILRLAVDDGDIEGQFDNKYGANLDECAALLAMAKTLGVKVVGVSFHVGHGGKAESYATALRDAEAVFKAGHALGHSMSVLDLGGGFPGTDSPDMSLQAIADIINPILNEPSSIWQTQQVSVIAEPGRFFCAEAQTLTTQIIGKRVRNGRRSYNISDGVYQSFNCILHDRSKLLPEDPFAMALANGEIGAGNGNIHNGRGYIPSTVFGQTSDGLDKVANDLLLPDLRIGDWLAIPNMGAYTNGASSRFNGFPSVPVIILAPTFDC